MMSFNSLFNTEKPIIGMIHLAGNSREEKIARALEELEIYQNEGVDGAIVEDYHGSPSDVYETLKAISMRQFSIVIGINVLRNPYSAFKLASDYGARFVQFDTVQTRDLNLTLYEQMRIEFKEIAVLGGVGFKYIPPTGNPLEQDLDEAKPRCEAVVTTGDGTGIETPLEKLKKYKNKLDDFPLVVGAGVNGQNAKDQLNIADGAIIGSFFKVQSNTRLPVDKNRVKSIMNIAREARAI